MSKSKDEVPAESPGQSLFSKFDPVPQASQEPPKTSPRSSATSAVQEAEPKKEEKEVPATRIPRAKTKKESTEKESKGSLEIGAGYIIKLKPDSGYRVFLDLMAREGKFGSVAEALETLDTSDAAACKAVLQKAMVRRDAIENVIRADARWQAHGKKRIEQLKIRANGNNAAKSKKARATLQNAKRVRDGEWVGDIQEIISTCCGAYESENRNIEKFDNAGVTFRRFPLKSGRDQPIYLMMFPVRYVSKIVSALKLVYPDEAKDEDVPKKFRKK